MNEGNGVRPGETGEAEPTPGGAGADGDFELARPATAPGDPAGDDFELAGPSTPAAGEPVVGEPVVREREAVTGSEAPVAAAPAPSPADRPKPLHDPDPYGTPPYGRPGPWAPAPPVQHPAATPAQGTAFPVPAEPPLAVPPATTRLEPPHIAPAAPAPAPDPATPPPADPWHRYDPWAAPASASTSAPAHAPLQQTGAAVPTVRERRGRARRILVGGAVALALVSGGVGGAVGAYLEREGGIGTITLPQAGKEPAGRPADSVAGIAARALPSVVTLHVKSGDEQATGTGFVLDTRGHILTNNHVVEPAAADGDITVTFSGGDTAGARIVGRDTGYDLAVVQVSGVHGLTPLPLGNSDNVRVGDPVVAIGAPFDLAGTVTSGIISATERPITAGGKRGDGSDVSYVDALQTDAPINPGNSGGPLLDSRARVVGINSAIRSADSGSDSGDGRAGSIGLGFAIPVNQARRVAEELINTGKATHPVIGVTLDMDYAGDGARIGTKGGNGGPAVTVGGPGDRAGLKAGDVITAIDGKAVHSGDELIIRTRAHRPGDHLRLTVRRDSRTREVSLVLGSSDSN
ncbi:trypsin-like peptidase domain-containing protein [Streptomyces sp. NPDC001480]|uniref:S1C family serine protease n=1 Tax=Streptomyces sp. NPDC001480 TaxID=3364577 RepID=UPI0036CC4553